MSPFSTLLQFQKHIRRKMLNAFHSLSTLTKDFQPIFEYYFTIVIPLFHCNHWETHHLYAFEILSKYNKIFYEVYNYFQLI